ncbi:MAG: CCA tRNA nucleotidyltransferase [Salinirussus sp.]
MPDAVDAVIDRVRARVTPDDDERAALEAALTTAIDRTNEALAELPVDATVRHLGSTARDTWLAGDRDIDIFVCFPPALDRADLEEYGLAVGHAVLPDGREEFAEHPYVVGEIDGFQVDLVPCYAVDDPTEIRSAVDRTPFHDAYLADRLDEHLAGEVRVTKQLLSAVGAYGSDLRTRGFSGFLVELLVLEYGGLRSLCEAAADWQPPMRIDPAGHGSATFEDPLVVIDPTDPERNVAAVCSAENVARFQHYSRALLATPDAALFEPSEPATLDQDALEAVIRHRSTSPVALRFTAPGVVEDQLYPQLEKSLTGIIAELDRRGFDVLRADAWADGDAVIFAELAVAERPAIERHEGPPVAVREHAERFYETYADDTTVTGPYIDGDRYVVERPREFTSAVEFLESDRLFDVGLGADVETALREHYDVLAGEAVAELRETFGAELSAFYEPNP